MLGALIWTAGGIDCAVQLPRYLPRLSLLSEVMPALPGHTEEEINGQSQTPEPPANPPLASAQHGISSVSHTVVNIILDLLLKN